jgi:hypothetical protein
VSTAKVDTWHYNNNKNKNKKNKKRRRRRIREEKKRGDLATFTPILAKEV